MQKDRDKLIEELLREIHRLAPADDGDNDIASVTTYDKEGKPARHKSRHEKTMHRYISTACVVVDKMSEAGSTIKTPPSIADDDQWTTDAETDIAEGDMDFEKGLTTNGVSEEKIVMKDDEAGLIIEHIECVENTSSEFNNSTPQDVLQALITNHEKRANEAFQACQYEHAEKYQRRMIQHAEEWNAMYEPPQSIEHMKKDLVRSLKSQNSDRKLDESETIIREMMSGTRSNLPSSPPPLRPPANVLSVEAAIENSFLYSTLADIKLRQHKLGQRSQDLKESSSNAKKSFTILYPYRHLPNIGFRQSVELFVKILETQEEPTDAETYRTLFLQPNAMSASQPQSIHQRIPSITPLQHTISFEDPNGLDSNGRPYLISAVIGNDMPRMDRLFAYNANPQVMFANKTALMHAVDTGCEPIITKLVNSGAIVDFDASENGTGFTALHYAITRLNPSMADTLLSHGADIELPYNGYTPLQCAARLKSPDLTAVLIRRGAAVNATDTDGLTALHHALRNDCTGADTARLLLHHSADPNIQSAGDKRTPLHFTVVDKNHEAARVLLEHGPIVDLEVEDAGGRTAAMLAALSGKYEVLEVLLKEGALIRWEKPPKDFRRNIEWLLNKTEKERSKNGGLMRAGSRASSVTDSVVGTRERKNSLNPFKRRISRTSSESR